jgi:uncharacterized delta-60 repeat protein
MQMQQQKIKEWQLDLNDLELYLRDIFIIRNWISLLNKPTWGTIGHGMALSSNEEVYLAGYTYSTDNVGIVVKYASSGELQWQRLLSDTSNIYAYGVAVDSNDNVCAVGEDWNGKLFIVKYNSSGQIQWQRTLAGSGAVGQGVAIDSNDDIYIIGDYTVSALRRVVVAKYNSNGVIQWQREISDAVGGVLAYSISTDSSNNIYISGATNAQGAGNYDALIAKYNSSGVIQWQRVLGGASVEYGRGIAVDTTSNIYVTGETQSQGAGGVDLFIAKYNTSGTIQWQRLLGGIGTDAGYKVAVGDDGVYVTGRTNSEGAGGLDALIAKYNSSGTIQWQRLLGGTGGDGGHGVALGQDEKIYFAGETAVNASAFIAKLPPDGSKTGTYNSLVYQTSTLTDQAATLTDQASTLTEAAGTMTEAAGTMTDQAGNHTTTIYYL